MKSDRSPADELTPEWLRRLGIGAGEWQVMPKAALRAVMADDSTPEHVKVWACGALHSFAYRGERAVRSRDGKLIALSPADIGRETGLIRQNVRRALAHLERAGLAYRAIQDGRRLTVLAPEERRQIKGRVQIYFCARPHVPPVRTAPAKHTNPLVRVLKRFGITNAPTDSPELLAPVSALHAEYRTALKRLKTRYRKRAAKLLDVSGHDYVTYTVATTRIAPTRKKTKAITPLEKKVKERREKRATTRNRKQARNPPRIPSAETDSDSLSRRAGGLAFRARETDPHTRQKETTSKEKQIAEIANARLTRTIGKALHTDSPADLKIIRAISRNLGDASPEQFAARIEARLDDIHSYALLPHLAADCAASAAEWSGTEAAEPKQPKKQQRDAVEQTWLRRRRKTK